MNLLEHIAQTDPADAQDLIIREFTETGDVFAQYTYLVELSSLMAPMTDAEREESTDVADCQSKVWILVRLDDAGRIRVVADSDTLIVRSVLSIFVALLDGKPAGRIDISFLDRFVYETELKETFSSARLKGFGAIKRTIAELIAPSREDERKPVAALDESK